MASPEEPPRYIRVLPSLERCRYSPLKSLPRRRKSGPGSPVTAGPNCATASAIVQDIVDYAGELVDDLATSSETSFRNAGIGAAHCSVLDDVM